MTILVAGGSGLVGSAILNELSLSKKQAVGISSKDVNLLNRSETFGDATINMILATDGPWFKGKDIAKILGYKIFLAKKMDHW